MSEQSRLVDDASRASADQRQANGCIHTLSCKCWQKWRVSAWLALDALREAGWTFTPPG